jgi:anti-sigma factor RsiW
LGSTTLLNQVSPVRLIEEALEMDSCGDHSLDILRYLDHQLGGQELKDFLAHLRTCKKCEAELEAEKALSGLLRESRPLYTAPAALHSRLATLVDRTPGQRGDSEAPYERLSAMIRRLWRSLLEWTPNWRLAIPVAAVIILGLIFVPGAIQQVDAASYVTAAATAHRSYLDGNLPLEIKSDSPEAVTAWFSDKLPFQFRLPSSHGNLVTPSIYRLTGGRVVNYKGSRAALVTYSSAQKEPISLLITSSKVAPVVGGEEVRDGSLTFHYHTNQGYKVITWSNRSLAYALVSDVSGSARGSCLVCHENMADRGAFKASR